MIIYFVYIFVNLLQNIKTLFHKRSIIDCFEIWQLVLSEFVSRFLLRSNFMVNVYGPEFFFFTFSVIGQGFWKATAYHFHTITCGTQWTLLLDMLFYRVFYVKCLGLMGMRK